MICPYVDSQSKWDAETPALTLNLDAVEANIQRMAAFFRGKSCQLRPHAKTHKLPLIAQKQIERSVSLILVRLAFWRICRSFI